MRFKKVYIEITNSCNLNCSFCNKIKRKNKIMTIDEFKIVINKIKPYTDYLYLHVMGEPLMHPNINELINLASRNFKINITTNGYLIKKVEDNKNIRQINISLQSILEKDIDNYLNTLYKSIDKLLENNTYVNLRVWINNDITKTIVDNISNHYKIIINGNTKLRENLFISFDEEFIWPNLDNNYYNDKGVCMGLKTHIGILSDGTVIPCCLDSNGIINLGNIFNEDLNDILNKEQVKNIINGFKDNKKIKELCKHCNFYDRISCKKEDYHG